jgi:hypothetical protein
MMLFGWRTEAMFDPENVERYRQGRSGMEKLSETEIASANPDDVYVKASAYDQLLVFYKAVPHSVGHIDCPACDATRDAIVASTKVPRTRRKTALKLVKK